MNKSSTEAQENIKSVIQRIATGPELSKNISREEAKRSMSDILNGQIDPVQSAIFLIALRMKRETMDCLLYTSPSPRDLSSSRMPSSA